MIVYLSGIYPDELVYSWFCRYYVHSGCLTHKMALQELYCKRSDNPSKEFMGNLNCDARNEIAKMYSLDRLTLENTMFPQYARFIPLEQRKKALHHIGQDPCDVHHLFCVLPRIDDEQFLRYCPLCAEEDRKQYGEAYWHRKHQLRNVKLCAKHGCKLEASEISAKSEHNYTFCPAQNAIHDKAVVYENDPLAIQFASYVSDVFDAQIDFENDIPVSSILYNGMSRTKYLKLSGRSRYTKMLSEDMKAFYETIELCSIASMYQIQRILLGSQFDFSVVCQIAFFLGITVKELTSPVLTKEQIQQERESHYMKDKVLVDWDELDAEIAPVLEAVARRIYDGTANENGRPERVSERLVYREMGLKRHQLEKMPRCRAIFEQYTESYPESWARKIVWAYQKLCNEGDKFYWSDIRQLSGVKKKNFSSIVPFLNKFVNVDIIHRIMVLADEVSE